MCYELNIHKIHKCAQNVGKLCTYFTKFSVTCVSWDGFTLNYTLLWKIKPQSVSEFYPKCINNEAMDTLKGLPPISFGKRSHKPVTNKNNKPTKSENLFIYLFT